MKLLTSKNYRQSVEAVFKGAKKTGDLRCAVAFWGKEAKKYHHLMGAKSKIVCNLESGATNPDVIKSFWKKNKKHVKTLDSLHAKVYLNSDTAIIGSANCSTNGLASEQENGWIEAGVMTTDPKLLQELDAGFEEIWKYAQLIRQEDIEDARTKWKARYKNRPWLNRRKKKRSGESNNSLLKAMEDNPTLFEGRRIYFVITTEGLSDGGKKAATNKGWHATDVYQDLKVPKNAHLIDLFKENGEWSIGLYNSPKSPIKEPFKEDGKSHSLIRVGKMKKLGSWKLTPHDIKRLKAKAQALLKKFENRDGAAIVPFERAKEVLFRQNG